MKKLAVITPRGADIFAISLPANYRNFDVTCDGYARLSIIFNASLEKIIPNNWAVVNSEAEMQGSIRML